MIWRYCGSARSGLVISVSRRPVADRGTDGVLATVLPAVDVAAEGEVLARRERVVGGELVGHVEGDGDRVVGEPLDVGDPEGVEGGGGHAQISLTCSKGSPQSRQR